MEIRISRDDLLMRSFGDGVFARLFDGSKHGLSNISLMFGEVRPGARVGLHRHAYEELFIIQEGQAEFTIGETTVSASAGDLVVIPLGVSHLFVNTGTQMLRQIAVHASQSVEIEWLE